MGANALSKVDNDEKAYKSSLITPPEPYFDYIPYLDSLSTETYVYTKRSTDAGTGRIYMTENYDVYNGLGQTCTPSSSTSQNLKIGFDSPEAIKAVTWRFRQYPITQDFVSPAIWKKKLKTLGADNEPYRDRTFKADLASIKGGMELNSDEDSLLKIITKYKIVWERPYLDMLRLVGGYQKLERLRLNQDDEYLMKKAAFFRAGGYNSSDIFQGVLGNSHFISALIAVARVPSRVKKLILYDPDDSRGAFGFTFCVNGCWKAIVIDDYLPFFRRGLKLEDYQRVKDPVYSEEVEQFRLDFVGARPYKNILWPLYMEKAYAKVSGGYFNMTRAGDARFTLTDLTGAPSEMMRIEDFPSKEVFWEELVRIFNEGFIICFKTISDYKARQVFQNRFRIFETGSVGKMLGKSPIKVLKSDFLRENIGLLPDQTYPLMGLQETEGSEAVKLRDPWGRLSFSQENKSDIDRRCSYSGDSFGKTKEMVVPLNIVWESFEQIFVCFWNSSYSYSNFSFKGGRNTFSCFELEIPKAAEYYIRVSQPSHFLSQLNANRRVQYPDLQLVLLKQSGTSYSYICGIKEAFRDVWADTEEIEASSESSKYLLYVRIKIIDLSNLDFSFSCFNFYPSLGDFRSDVARIARSISESASTDQRPSKPRESGTRKKVKAKASKETSGTN